MGFYKWIERFSFFSFVVLAIFGGVCVIVLSHELSHQQDYKEYVTEDYVCALVWPESFGGLFNGKAVGGYYQMLESDKSKASEISEIGQRTEFKAYAISFLGVILFAIMINMVIKERFKSSFRKRLMRDLQINEEAYLYE